MKRGYYWAYTKRGWTLEKGEGFIMESFLSTIQNERYNSIGNLSNYSIYCIQLFSCCVSKFWRLSPYHICFVEAVGHYDYCDPNPCKHGGLCSYSSEYVSCHCPEGITGQLCGVGKTFRLWLDLSSFIYMSLKLLIINSKLSRLSSQAIPLIKHCMDSVKYF